jgi:hypothetical protein
LRLRLHVQQHAVLVHFRLHQAVSSHPKYLIQQLRGHAAPSGNECGNPFQETACPSSFQAAHAWVGRIKNGAQITFSDQLVPLNNRQFLKLIATAVAERTATTLEVPWREG